MKSILLKEELQRISEIMNISPKLIIEGITPSKAAEEFLGKLFGGKSSAEAADEILAKIRKGETGVADKAAASEAFSKLLEKEVYTDVERTFVTQIIDKLFPEFVKAENGKLIGLLNNVPNEGARSTLKSMLLDVEHASDIEVATTINLLDSKFNVSPENIRMFRNKIKREPIKVPETTKPTSGVGSRESGKPADNIIGRTEPINYPTPTEIDAAIDNLINSSTDGNVIQGMNDFIDNFVSDEVSKGNIKLGKLTESEIANDIKKILNPQAQFTVDVINKAFEGKTTAEQRKIAQKIVKNLEESLPPEIKSKPWFKKSLGGIFSNATFFAEVGSIFPTRKFIYAVIGVYIAIATIQAIVEFNFREGTDWKGKLENSLKWGKTWIGNGVGDPINFSTPSTSTESSSGTITTEAQLRKKYPCINETPGVTFSKIVNNQCTATFNGKTYTIVINGDKATYEDGSPIC